MRYFRIYFVVIDHDSDRREVEETTIVEADDEREAIEIFVRDMKETGESFYIRSTSEAY